jgi:hypothetical protein
MESNARTRFWLESALASLCGLLALVTVLRRDWIEAVTGFDPDRHSGALELASVVVLLVLFVVMTRAARLEWRRLRAAPVPPH